MGSDARSASLGMPPGAEGAAAEGVVPNAERVRPAWPARPGRLVGPIGAGSGRVRGLRDQRLDREHRGRRLRSTRRRKRKRRQPRIEVRRQRQLQRGDAGQRIVDRLGREHRRRRQRCAGPGHGARRGAGVECVRQPRDGGSIGHAGNLRSELRQLARARRRALCSGSGGRRRITWRQGSHGTCRLRHPRARQAHPRCGPQASSKAR